MTHEQKSIIDRCARMLRRAFHQSAGKVTYRLEGEKPVRWEFAQYGRECSCDEDQCNCVCDGSAVVDITA